MCPVEARLRRRAVRRRPTLRSSVRGLVRAESVHGRRASGQINCVSVPTIGRPPARSTPRGGAERTSSTAHVAARDILGHRSDISPGGVARDAIGLFHPSKDGKRHRGLDHPQVGSIARRPRGWHLRPARRAPDERKSDSGTAPYPSRPGRHLLQWPG